MVNCTVACSISRPVAELISGRIAARVFSSSPSSCALVTPSQDVVLLVSQAIGNGPLNIVLDVPLEQVDRDTPAASCEGLLRVGSAVVSLDRARIWEPCPDWARLVAGRSRAAEQIDSLQAVADRLAPCESLLWSVRQLPGNRGDQNIDVPDFSVAARARVGAAALTAGWGGDAGKAARGGVELGGLGRGLTPAGDDFLVGVMLWSWLAHPDPPSFCSILAEAAIPRTTTLSAAWLRAAAKGQFGAPLHGLLDALVGRGVLEIAAARVMSYGATSGADTLAGLLWIGMSRLPAGADSAGACSKA